MTLRVGPGPRVVQVREGRLWITASGTERAAPIDVWLVPGDSLELPDGLSVVLEAWPGARFQLLVPPSACAGTGRGAIGARFAAWALRQLRGRVGSALQPSALYAH